MKLVITDALFEQHPEACLGVITAHGLDIRTDKPELLNDLRAAEAALAAKIGDAVLIQHPHIAPWREAYRRFGAKPKKYPSSIENLIRRTLKGAQLPLINNLVAVYNTTSLLHLLPVGGEDLDQIQGDILLTVAGQDEARVQLLGESSARAPYPGEIIYKDSIGTICRRWNWKEADRTKLTQETRRAVLVIETIPPLTREKLTAALSDLHHRIEAHCGSQVRSHILDRSQPECSLQT
jgi:lysyl-tRNA synthetase class 2